ncbi:MAG: HAD-IA family hydrolase [Bacteroidales bacterium]|jgi:putative hydrolase of the HAD superfamily|nr:HAD-IA family hydrolase [Bacteroidales bacterium]
MNNIKNLLLDLGGVILNVDYNRTVEEFYKLNIRDFDKYFTQKQQTDIISSFEEGNISKQDFFSYIRKIANNDFLTEKQIDDAWFSMCLDVPNKVIHLLGELKLKYNLYLFSNTNELHIYKLRKNMEETFGFDIFTMLFNKVYFSNEIHKRKPHVSSFQWVLNDAGILPEETLFIEDSIQHIEGAKQAGLNTYWLTKGETLNDIYDKKII